MADVVIIGAGPAGIFAALELRRLRPQLKIEIIEQGHSIQQRSRRGQDILRGWGGAGAFSDGKLTFSAEVGGTLATLVSEAELMAMLDYIDEVYGRYADTGAMFPADDLEWITRKANLAGLTYVPTRVRHIGTENCYTILHRMQDELESSVTLHFDVSAEEILVADSRVRGVRLSDGSCIDASHVIAAPGRVGSAWMAAEARRLGLTAWTNPVDLGVRVELPAVIMEDLTNAAYETKLICHTKSFDDRVRTFCMNPYGEVVRETLSDIVTVNGHSWANKRTCNTNFALLVSADFSEPFDDPIGYGQHVARLANMLGKGVLVQRLGDLHAGRRTTPERLRRCLTRPTLTDAEPGDLSYCLPYRILKDILEMLERLDELAPGVNSDHTLLYGIEAKFYSNRVKLDASLETEIAGLYAVGDGAGITRGLIQASLSGVIAARAIAAL